ncbi:unnamed protein product [Sphagnum jensenii]|uniref:Uncharacterized protein n=1 Tax=Sphagnum jensenii TaxID=128206 RepID=A0ABP0XAJ8_9BRYO
MGATEDVRYGNLDYEGAANLHRWEMKNGKKSEMEESSRRSIEKRRDEESRTVLMENVLRDEVLGPSTRFKCTMGKTKRAQFGEKNYRKVLSETEVFNEENPSNHLRKTPISIFIRERAANQKVPCSSVHERFFESQGSNGLLGHRSRAVARQQLRLGELTGCVPNTSPTPPTNPLSIFGSPYSRKSRRVELGQCRLFHDGDEQNKPWTVESAIVQPNDRFERGQEYLATESHSGEIKHPTKLPVVKKT